MKEPNKEFIIGLAKDAGKKALDFLGKAKVSSKGAKDVVTEADYAVEKFIIKTIKSSFPSHNIVAEESDNSFDAKKPTWYIDPIDGTANYCKGDQNFAVSIAFADVKLKLACIFIPMASEVYFAEAGKGAELNGHKIGVSKVTRLTDATIHLGISPLKDKIDDSLEMFKYYTINGFRARDYGFSAGQLCFVAAGRADGFVKISQHPWDIAAGMLIIEEAGGKVTDDFGKELKLGDSKARHNIIASNGKFHDELVASLNNGLRRIDRKNSWW